MEKQIVLRIKVDCDKDEFRNLVSMKGFENGKPIQNAIELIGLLEIMKQQEMKRLFKTEVGKK